MKSKRWILIVLWWGICLIVLVACTRRYPGGSDSPNPVALPENQFVAAPTATGVLSDTISLPFVGTTPLTATQSSTITLPLVSSEITPTQPVTAGVGLSQTLPSLSGMVEPAAGITLTLPLMPVDVIPLSSPAPADTAISRVVAGRSRFAIQGGTPVGTQNFLYTDTACGWNGVVGQIFDQAGTPLGGLIVQVGGILEGHEFMGLALTGSSRAVGPGGFEVRLGDRPIASQGTLFMQVYDLGGRAVSPAIPFNTYADCDQNMILANFVELPLSTQYLPYIPASTSP